MVSIDAKVGTCHGCQHMLREGSSDEEKEVQQRELGSGVNSTGIEDDEWMAAIDDELFEGGKERPEARSRWSRRDRTMPDVAEDRKPTEPSQEIGPLPRMQTITQQMKTPQHTVVSRK